MTQQETSVEVDTDTFEDHLPDWFEGDTVTIEVKAFSDCVYLDFPRFDSVERRIQSFVEKDSKLFNHQSDANGYPIDRSEIQTRDEAITLLFDDLQEYDRDYTPSNTTQYCVDAHTLFRTFLQVSVDRDNDVSVEAVTKKLKKTRRGIVKSTTHHSPETLDDAHLLLYQEFCETVSDVTDDEYWKGYKRGSGDTWEDVLYEAFNGRWDGNTDLMLQAGEWLTTMGKVPCNRQNLCFDIPEWSTPTGSYVATIASNVANDCPNCGADKDEHWECIKSSRRTRVPNKYKCTDCGFTKSGITTG